MVDALLKGHEAAHLHALALRSDFQTFVAKVFHELLPGDHFIDNWHIDAICHAIMQTIDGPDQRLIVTMPPRSLKSLIISVALPAFLLGRDPTRRIVCISYAEELSAKLAGDFRKVIGSSWYRRNFPAVVITKNTEREIVTSRGGGRFSTTVGGALTGRGGNLFVIDDPLKPVDAFSKARREAVIEWLRSTLASRPDDKRVDKMILVMQRLHVDDPAGVLLATGQWRHLNLSAVAAVDELIPLSHGRTHRRLAGTALDATREPLDVLDRLRADMGGAAFSAQYLQNPAPVEGGLFKPQWFRHADRFPYDEPEAFIAQSWDTAMTMSDNSDWSVCTTWLIHGDRYYLMEVKRGRYPFPALKRMVVAQRRCYDPAYILIERNGVGLALVQQLEAEGVPIERCVSKDEKEVRAATASVAVETGRVYLPSRLDASMHAFLDEVLMFPGGRHDDHVDSMSQCINWWEGRRRQPRYTCLVGRY